MPTNPQDYVPSPPPLERIGIYTLPRIYHSSQATRPRRGGRRPGAGARPGNLNALKHGRYSRFKELLPPEPFDPAVPARTLLLQQRTEAERIAASFFRVLLQARWQRDAADAVAEGRPVPPPPLVPPTRRDHARVLSFMEASNTLAGLDRFAATEGATPNPAALAEYRRRAEQLDEALPVVALLLDRAAQPTATPQSLAALLRNEIGFNQSTPLPIESTARALAAIAESASPQPRKTTQSISSAPPPQPFSEQRAESAPLSHAVGEGPGEGED
jgi:hypothetical protein